MILFLVAATGLYLGGSRRAVVGPAFLAGAALWGLLACRAVGEMRSGKRMVDLVDLPVFLFLGYAGWAVLRAPCEYFGRLEWLLASVYGAVFLAVRHQLPTRKMIPWILGALVAVALLTELFGFLHFRVGTYPIGPVPLLGWEMVPRPDYEERMSGTFGCPNHFGNYLVQAGLAALTLAIWPGLPWAARILAGWAVPALAAGVFFSISRGSWLAWVTANGVWLFRWLRRGPLNALGRGAVLLVAGGLLLGGYGAARGDSAVMARWQKIIGQGEGVAKFLSGEGDFRLALAKDGLAIWQKAPWFGTGPGSFDIEHQRLSTWSYGTRAVYTHNDYVNTLSDYGAVGAALVALFWLFLAAFLWRRTRTRERGSAADACTGMGWAVMVAMLIHALVDFNYHVPATAISSFLLLGLATTVTWGERGRAGARVWNSCFLGMALLGMGLTGWQGGKTWAGWNSVPEKAEQAAKLTEEELAECGRKADASDPRSPVLAEVLGDAYRLKLVELYFSPQPDSPTGREMRQENERRLAEAAIHWYREQEKRSPKDDVAFVRRAGVLDLQGKFSEAAPLYLLALQQRPHSVFFQTSYGNHLWRKGDTEGAQKQFEKALELPGLHRPGDGVDPAVEAKEMLEKVKEQIAKGGTKRQSQTFNPRED
ncbi:hypothetical protein EBX31_09565 [bacterium]|nr:hypothetical protein [bacterium]